VSAIDTRTLTIADAATLLRSGRLTARDLTEACLDRIASDNPRLNAFILVTAESARAQADQADRERRAGHDRGPLHGIPISIKDLVDIAGLPTTAASRVRAGHIAQSDAPIITNVRNAGAGFVGKTNLHEFAMGTTNAESAFGPALHPLDQTRSPGGSSGGSAASVVAGMCLATVGSDTGGSIRIPSAVCGLVGLKPAWNDLSCDGVVPLGRSLDCVGPLARSVDDAVIVYTAMAGRTPHAAPIPEFGAQRKPRFGALRGYFVEKLQAEVRTRFDASLARLGADADAIDPIEIAHARFASSIYLPTVLAEGAEYHAQTLDRLPDAYVPGVRLRFELGRYVLAEDYLRAQRGRDRLRAEINAALAGRDALLLPTIPIVAPPLGATKLAMDDGRDEPLRAAMLRLTQPFNLTGHAALSLPIRLGEKPGPTGADATGLPVGLQIVAHDLPALLAAARWCEQILQNAA
jgi:aspartyl-tRNA(Asn)/glutamyl-tRNA(Gln) amidotransferase subunit A